MSITKNQDDRVLEICKYLWEEFKYRHDLIWQRTFRLTAVVVVLSIIPYVQRDITALLGYLILFTPFLASILASFSIMVMKNELDLFDDIKKAYWIQQSLLLPDVLKHNPDNKGLFYGFVLFYTSCLALLSFFNLFFVWLLWIPRILSSTPKPIY